eukprot:COSAG03_NODE_1548_length_3894_cov_36.405007_4_plen_32_part_00
MFEFVKANDKATTDGKTTSTFSLATHFRIQI